MRVDEQQQASTSLKKSAVYEELEQKKFEIENELKELEKVLQQEGNVGMTAPLVDNEGYPRADIDLYKVRLARQQINCLRNDYKQVMDRIEVELEKIYSSTSPEPNAVESEPKNDSSNNNARTTSTTTSVAAKGRPFCVVTQVDAGSPAAEAGIQVNDEIVQFGPYVHGTVAKNLSQIGELVKTSVNKIVLLNIARAADNSNAATSEKTYVKCKLVPKTWSGHGLLGCKIVPLD